jgi:hypothetical protein
MRKVVADWLDTERGAYRKVRVRHTSLEKIKLGIRGRNASIEDKGGTRGRKREQGSWIPDLGIVNFMYADVTVQSIFQ